MPIGYELPLAAVTEVIVNAIAHRDYTSNESVQIMLFKDRLEIWNPGSLPYGLSTAKLRKPHPSIPTNPLLAEPMYLAGYIELMGTGTGDVIRLCKEVGLKEPDFIQEEIFKTIIWRTKQDVVTDNVRQVTRQVDEVVNESIKRVVLVLEGEKKRAEIQEQLGLKDRENFVLNYITPALETSYIERSNPETLTHKEQRYRLSNKGIELKKKLKKLKKEK